MIDKNLIILDSTIKNKEEAVIEMSNAAKDYGYINDLKQYREKVESRENEFSTAVGYEIAIPHGKTDAVNRPFIVFLRVRKKLKWDKSEKYVKLIFMLGVPEKEENNLHLKILASLSKQLLDNNFRHSMINGDVNSVVTRLTEIEKQVTQK